MNFDFEDHQYEFRETFARTLARVLPPQRLQGGGKVGAMAAGAWESLAGLGLFAVLVPLEYGGMGLGFVDLALIVEELGKVLAPLCITDTLIATDLIVRFGTSEQRRAYLPAIATGALRIALADAELQADRDRLSITTQLSGFGDGLRLRGAKTLVADAVTAQLILATARGSAGGVEIVLVDPASLGVSRRPQATLDPACCMAEIVFDDVAVTQAQRLAAPVGRLFDAGAVVSAGLLIGLAGVALGLAVDYAKIRVQFGRAIGSFQAIKHRCADMAVSHDGGQAAAYYGFWALAENSADVARAASVAKAFCGEAARTICNETIQVHGGMGFTWDLGLHYYLRRAKMLECAFGDSAFHRERALSASLAILASTGARAAEVARQPAPTKQMPADVPAA